MKKAPDSIFKLIKAMTVAEKRYVKRDLNKYTANTENYNSLLFDALNALDVYDETKLLKKIKSSKLKKNFRVQKQYLFDAILERLRSYEALTDMETQLRNKMENCRILIKKGLLGEALVEVDGILEKSRAYELYLIWLDALWLKHDAMQGVERNRDYKEETRKIFKELNELAQLNGQFIKGRACNAEFFFLRSHPTMGKEIDPKIYEVKRQNDENSKVQSDKIRQLYLTNQIQFCGLTKDYVEFTKVGKIALENIENSYLKKTAPVAYFIALANYAYGLNETSQHLELATLLKKWEEELTKDYWGKVTKARSIAIIRRYSRMLKLLGLLPTALGDEFKFDLKETTLYECVYAEYNSLIEYEFIQGNFDRVLQVIFEQETFASRGLRVLDKRRNKLLEVIIGYEQGNLITLTSAVDKAKYFHKKNKLYTDLEMFFLNRFNKYYPTEIEQFLPVYEKWKEQNKEDFLIQLWLEAKGTKRRLIDCYRAKIRAVACS
ncbi:hypothetical protein [Aureispira anguillae]|uniref:Uncharacterized protein n=1 Tax=Aureispira anguillae TaxID=2864201 RepID=A0A915YM68_9BACT|nr:hypothetical protein [Aureispira anguillae]BDS15502.1 hypothetical protein AsAng_0062860 [Aureispira anguillae]